MELLRITRQIHCKTVEQRATLMHRQYNLQIYQTLQIPYALQLMYQLLRDRIQCSRPPIDPYITPPCYKILAAPLILIN